MAIKKINTDLQIEAGLRDGDGDLGTNNQVLVSTGTGINWIDGSGTGIIGGPYLPLAGGTMTGTNGVVLPDNFKLNLGNSSDLQIYHDGSNSYITDVGTGNLNIKGGQGLALFSSSDEFFLYGDTNGQVNLYHNGLKKLETTSGGVTITGELQATTLDINGNADISGNLTLSGIMDILMVDNSGAAVEFKQGSDLYLRFITTNGGEKIQVNKTCELQGITATSGAFTSTLSAPTLDINGNADISGIISGNFVVRSTNNSNADGANFAVDTTNKNSSEYAYEVLRSGTTVAGITTVGKITGTELEGTSLDINGNGDVSGNLTINGALTANGGITGFDTAGGISGNNYNITGVNQLTINDPGEGIVFSGTTNVQLFTIDDTTDSILKVTSATALDVNAKITNLSPGSANLDAVNYQQLTDAVAGVLVYQGTWNASTNTPALASGVGTPGYYYIVSTPGSTNLDGITDWNTGDWVIFSDQATDAWQKIDHTNVLNGAGTGNQVTKWSGAGTSYTLADSSITDNGTSVGIGITTPNAANKLEVTGQLRVVGNTMIGNSGTTNAALMPLHIKASGEPGIRIEDSDLNNLAFDITVNEGDGFKITETTGGDPGTDVRLFIEETTGNVGIGTTSPSAKLDVKTQTAPFTALKVSNYGTNVNALYAGSIDDTYLYFGSGFYYNSSKFRAPSTTAAITSYDSGVFRVFTNSGLTANTDYTPTERMRINSTGNVGIGTASPGEKLHVDGNARVTGAYYDSNNSPGTSGQILSSTVTGADWIDNAHIPSPAPVTPGSIVSTIVGQTIEIAFNQSTTANIDYYQVWSSDDGGDYGIIAQIPPTDFSATMTVVDTSFSTGGTMSYRVYAVKSGVYSSPGTTSKTYTVGSLDVTDMTVINLNTAYYIQYEKPASRFIDHIEIYMDSQTTQGALNRSNASIIYSGQNTSFMKSVGVSNNFHQFWVEVVTT